MGAGEYLILLGLAGVAGVLLLLVYAFGDGILRRKKGGSEIGSALQMSVWTKVLVGSVIVGLIALAIVLFQWFREHGPVRPPALRLGHLVSPVSPTSPWRGWTWWPAILVAVTIGVAVLAFVLTNRRRSGPAETRERARMAEIVRHSIDEIQRDPDPRHAVISAYVRMEEELGDEGWPRRPSLAPFEYIEAALGNLAIPREPTRSLTELFEIARFSRRPIDDSMKERAIIALVDISTALQPATP